MSDCTLPEPLDAILSELEALRARPEYQAWCRFQRSFHLYSLPNRLLIRDQRPDATLIGSTGHWAKWGREPRPGERPLRVMAPAAGRYRPVPVWDVTQTTGAELPNCPLRPVTATNPHRLLQRLERRADQLGVLVEYVGPSLTGAHGWYSPGLKRISIIRSFPAAEQVRTLLHELAHAATPTKIRTELSRAEQEVIAELSVIAAAWRLEGLGLGDVSIAYLDGWLTGNALPHRLLIAALATSSQSSAEVPTTA